VAKWPLALTVGTSDKATAKSSTAANIMFLFFITQFSFYCFGLPWLPTVRGHFGPFRGVLRKIRRFVTRKIKKIRNRRCRGYHRSIPSWRPPRRTPYNCTRDSAPPIRLPSGQAWSRPTSFDPCYPCDPWWNFTGEGGVLYLKSSSKLVTLVRFNLAKKLRRFISPPQAS